VSKKDKKSAKKKKSTQKKGTAPMITLNLGQQDGNIGSSSRNDKL